MNAWGKYPVIYEINTWVWLDELSRKHGKPVTLATVPDQEWDAIAAYGFDAVWLMGVWERSPAGHRHLDEERRSACGFPRALADFSLRTMSARPIACGATSWISTWEGRRDLLQRERNWPSVACD